MSFLWWKKSNLSRGNAQPVKAEFLLAAVFRGEKE